MEWITDRKPEDSGRYLAVQHTGYITIREFVHGYDYEIRGEICHVKSHWRCEEKGKGNIKIIGWMPLPDVPPEVVNPVFLEIEKLEKQRKNISRKISELKKEVSA